MYSFPPVSAAIGLPIRFNSVSNSMIVLLMSDCRPGIRDLITVSKCFDSTFPRCTEPILEARCLYSGVVAKYSFSLFRAAIISTCLLISAWERLTTPIQGKFSLYAFPSRISDASVPLSIRSIFVKTPNVLSPLGSTSREILIASE
ncbi:hypothetical protein V8G54_010126, partial [Vigna mungo]